jgi:L-aminopeptidase/D-esterase-like protein
VIDGFAIGHHTADGDGWLTGTTVVLARAGAVGGVDVRGGGPGTRETDALSPLALVDQVHAVVLTGGSAYGLAAADGVMSGLEAAGIGFPVGPQPHQIVPIVPAAVIFDLGRGGAFGHRPNADFGARALAAASATDPLSGCVGGGTGGQTRGLKGGFGYAQAELADGRQVAAAVVVNAAGSPVDPLDGRLWSDRHRRLTTPTEAEREALAAAAARTDPSLATTIGVVLTSATLTKAQATKVAAVAHDGLARAIRPVHSMSDGDTIFCLASGAHPAPVDVRAAMVGFNDLLTAAADVFTDACFDALVSATTRGVRQSYRDLAPSAFSDWG